MSTKTELWTLRDLRTAKIDPGQPVEVERNKPVVFYIPTFQRSLVWPLEKKQTLIDSILRGFPFGSLLLVEHDTKVEVTLEDGTKVHATNYGIIDGLQRTNAIVDHLRRPLQFAPESVLEGAEFDGFHAALDAESGTPAEAPLLIAAVLRWMRETETTDIARGFDIQTLLDAVSIGTGYPAWSRAQERALRKPTAEFLKHVQNRLDISQQQVPVLIYTGPRDQLPEIFERINRQGTVLSKYEVFAASWTHTDVQVTNKDIKNLIARRYKRLEDEGYILAENGAADRYSLFDYLFGLSQHLGEAYPRLFSKVGASKGILSSAFPLATLMFGKQLDAMSELHRTFPTLSDGSLEVAPFEAALIAAVERIDSILAPYLGFTFVSDKDSLAHGELQMVSMVAAACAQMFDHKDGFKARPRRAVARALKEMGLAVPQHYIYDLMRNHWRGALYTYAYQSVWDANGKPSKAYLTTVDGQSFRSVLSTMHAEQMADLTHRRKNVTATDRAFLRFLYSSKVSVGDQAAHTFDVEHWIPVKRIQHLTAGTDPWALGALGNLGVLPAGANRIKKDETVSEYLSRTGKSAPDANTAALLQRLLFVPAADISIPKKRGQDAMTRAEYDAFVNLNWDQMNKQLTKALGIPAVAGAASSTGGRAAKKKSRAGKAH